MRTLIDSKGTYNFADFHFGASCSLDRCSVAGDNETRGGGPFAAANLSNR